MMVYMDETSTHNWDRVSKIWQPMDERLKPRFKSSRGVSFTVYGAICNSWDVMLYNIGPSTLKLWVKDFIKMIHMSRDPQKQVVVVLDQHKCHNNPEILDYAKSLNMILLFTPPTES